MEKLNDILKRRKFCERNSFQRVQELANENGCKQLQQPIVIKTNEQIVLKLSLLSYIFIFSKGFLEKNVAFGDGLTYKNTRM